MNNTYAKRSKWQRVLRNFDIFSVHIQPYFHRHDPHQDKSEQYRNYGSNFGGSMSLFFLALMWIYVSIQLADMNSGEYDLINSTVLTNNFGPLTNKVEMNQTNFMPYVMLQQLQDDYAKMDILDKAGNISYDKFKNYVDVFFIIDQRINNQWTSFIRPFRICTLDDFIKR